MRSHEQPDLRRHVVRRPFLIGPGMAIIIDLGTTFGLFAGLDTQVGWSRFTLNFDFNVGVTFKH